MDFPTLICFSIFKLSFSILNPANTGIKTSSIISSQYFFTKVLASRTLRYAIVNSSVKRDIIIQNTASMNPTISFVSSNNGSGILMKNIRYLPNQKHKLASMKMWNSLVLF